MLLRKKITIENYLECLQKHENLTKEQRTLRSIEHNVYSIVQQKKALSPADDKRYLIEPDHVYTLVWGHYEIEN